MANNENGPENRWELSLYEQNREPQPVIMDDTEITVTPRSLHSEVMCPICLDILNVTMTTKECLHRFCRSCITTAIRNSNRECPTCRKKIVSGRSLRRDINFDHLITAIFGNREEYMEHHAGLMERKVSRIINDNNLRSARTTNGSNGEARTNGDDHNTNHVSGESDQSEAEGQEREMQNVEVVVFPLPSESSAIDIRCLSLDQDASVEHLARYMEIRHDAKDGRTNTDSAAAASSSSSSFEAHGEGDTPPPFTLYILAGLGEYKPLPLAMTLRQVGAQISPNRSADSSLQLYYGYRVQPSS